MRYTRQEITFLYKRICVKYKPNGNGKKILSVDINVNPVSVAIRVALKRLLMLMSSSLDPSIGTDIPHSQAY